jgi:hypothetical protein
MQFEMTEQPRIEERLRAEEAQRQKTMAAEDRARAISMDDLRRRESETRIKDLEADRASAISMDDLKRRESDRRIRGMEAEMRARGLETVPAGSDLVETATGKMIYRGQSRAEPSRDEYRSAPGVGVYNTRTGQVTTPAAPRPSRVPPAAYARIDNLNELRQNAIDWWAKWSQLPEGSPERQEAEKQASAALNNYNAAVDEFGTTFGEWFETGPGDNGWNYVQPRKGQTQGAAPRPSQPTRNLKDLEKLWN